MTAIDLFHVVSAHGRIAHDTLCLDNLRDFTQMGQMAFKSLMLSLLFVIINCLHIYSHISFHPYDALFVFFIFLYLGIFHFPLSYQAKFIKKKKTKKKQQNLKYKL